MGNSWEKLREKVDKESKIALQERLKTNPVPTDLECIIGAFLEQLEWQVRDAVVAFNKKGYSTDSSGFYSAEQVIDGEFKFRADTVKSIEKLGAKVGGGKKWTEIRFLPKEQDLKKIKETWDQIAEILPNRGQVAEPSTALEAGEFRKKYKKCYALPKLEGRRRIMGDEDKN